MGHSLATLLEGKGWKERASVKMTIFQQVELILPSRDKNVIPRTEKRSLSLIVNYQPFHAKQLRMQ